MTRVLFGHATFPESKKEKKKGVENLGALLEAVVDMDIDGISASGTVRTMYMLRVC
jgi:hypothetical protein